MRAHLVMQNVVDHELLMTIRADETAELSWRSGERRVELEGVWMGRKGASQTMEFAGVEVRRVRRFAPVEGWHETPVSGALLLPVEMYSHGVSTPIPAGPLSGATGVVPESLRRLLIAPSGWILADMAFRPR